MSPRSSGESAACALHHGEVRWGPNLERFVCPDCGGERGWWLPARQLAEYHHCYHQTFPTAGTVVHGARLPFWKWFWAMFQEAYAKKGMAAMAVAKQIQACY